MPTISPTLVSVTLTASAEHTKAFAHNLGAKLVESKVECDRETLTFAFEDYYDAVNFQMSLGSVRGFVSAKIGKS